MAGISFRRIHGRIVPIRAAADKFGSDPIKRKAVKATIGGAALVAGAIGAASKKPVDTSNLSRTFHLAAGYGLQVVSGIVSALPTRGIKGFGVNLAGSVAADTLSTANFARASAGLKGVSRREKVKDFAKHQAIGTGIGYATFGAGLLANPKVRSKFLEWGAKIAKKVVLR